MNTWSTQIAGKNYEIQANGKWVWINGEKCKINLMNGAVGGALAGAGVGMTAYVATKPNVSTGYKLLVSVAVLIGCWAAVFVMAGLLSGILYR